MPELRLGRYRLAFGKADDKPEPHEAPEHNPTEPTAVALEFMLRASARADQMQYIQVENVGFKSQIENLLNRNSLIDLYTVAYAVTEIRTVITRLREETFRRGVEIKPAFAKKCPSCAKQFDENVEVCDIVDTIHVALLEKLKIEYPDKDFDGVPLVEPDGEQLEHLEAFIGNVNTFEQNLLDVFSELEDDFNIVDDCFLHLIYEYLQGTQKDPKTDQEQKIVTHGKLLQVLRVDPVAIEFDLTTRGVPGEQTWFCLQHRGETSTEPNRDCPKCGCMTVPAFYKMRIESTQATATHYLASWEIVHTSKFSPSRTYGYPPLLTVLDKALMLWGADKLLYEQFYERKIPRGLIVTVTSDVEGFLRQKREIEQRLQQDPNYIPWIGIRPGQRSTAQTKWVGLQPSPAEMQYSSVRAEVAERVGSMWGMPPLYQGSMEGVGGMNAETQQIVVAGRVVEADQRRFNDKIIPKVLSALGVEDWLLTLQPPEEQSPDKDLDLLQKRASVAKAMWSLGFDLDWQPQTQTFKYKVPEGGLAPRGPEAGAPDLAGLLGANGDQPTDEQIVGTAKITTPGGRVRTAKADELLGAGNFRTSVFGPSRLERDEENDDVEP